MSIVHDSCRHITHHHGLLCQSVSQVDHICEGSGRAGSKGSGRAGSKGSCGHANACAARDRAQRERERVLVAAPRPYAVKAELDVRPGESLDKGVCIVPVSDSLCLIYLHIF
jgi:hypothetical protein